SSYATVYLLLTLCIAAYFFFFQAEVCFFHAEESRGLVGVYRGQQCLLYAGSGVAAIRHTRGSLAVAMPGGATGLTP
ncbi:hypothetical protein, partial [Escherichia coli]|uniref:hypothetical protein n=1 Tax=Escherichia coli TaxID=562 RepID=UPI001BFD8EEF